MIDTDLWMAAVTGDTEYVLNYLENPEVGFQSREGNTALEAAMMTQNMQLVELLLARGVDIEGSVWHLIPPLMRVAGFGYPDMVRMLIDRGANINARSSGRGTALHLAADNGHTDIVRILLAHGADPHAVDDRGNTALMLARRMKHPDTVAILTEAMASSSME